MRGRPTGGGGGGGLFCMSDRLCSFTRRRHEAKIYESCWLRVRGRRKRGLWGDEARRKFHM